MNDPSPSQGMRIYEWINRRAWPIAAALVVLAVVLAGLFPVVADQGEPSFDPKGQIYETRDRAQDVFSTSSPIRSVSFIIENPNGDDVLTRDSLLELKQNQDAVLADAESQLHLTSSFDRELGITVDGMFSVANAVDEALPSGLEAATDGDVKQALDALLADGAPTSSLRFLLSGTSTTSTPTTIGDETIVVWRSPAFFAQLLFNIETFDPEQMQESFGDDTNLDAERWLRDVQTTLRTGDNVTVTCLAGRSSPESSVSWWWQDGTERLMDGPQDRQWVTPVRGEFLKKHFLFPLFYFYYGFFF